MPVKKVFEGSVDYVQILDKDGKVDKKLEPELSNDVLDQMYRHLVRARTWDKKCLALQRTGRMYTYAPVEGQEAISVGTGMALGPEDWIFPTFRESYMYYMRGVPLETINLEWMGWEEGLKVDKKFRSFPLAIPIGTQLPHGVGAAYALKMQGKKAAVLTYGGDGSTSEGEFHDALNFAGVWDAPVVIVISNNHYAISVPRKLQTRSETIAQKALAYGIQGIQVDGNDILAVYKVTKQAIESAKNGKPVLIEFVTYRMGPHTTADDPTKYRNEEEVAYWRERDPIMRFQIYLKEKGIWNEEYEKEVVEEATKIVEEAVEKSEAFKGDPKEIFKYVYANMTPELERQMKEAFE